ncbi:MAG: hypothetical protein O3A20_05480 [Planctomycetota bacterium]|nr:hypothetical protein [Planctomycetota bacterium]
MLTASILLTLALFPQAGAWRIMPGSRPDPLPIPVERVKEGYFKGLSASLAKLDQLDAAPETSRLVIGLPSVDPAIAALAERFGVTARGDTLAFQGRALRAGSGLRLSAPDPDGAGQLVLVVAGDETGLLAPFTVRLDLLGSGFTIATAGQILEQGALPLFRADELAAARALAIRLDLDCGSILDETEGWPLGERARRLALAFAGYADVLERVAGAPISPEAFFASLLHSPAEDLAQARTRFSARRMQDLADKMWGRTSEVLGPPAGPAPLIHFLLAPAGWTNAATFDPAEPGGRPRILINLTAFADHVALETALAHECAHVRQAALLPSLLGRCAHEGVAVFISQQLIPGTPDAAALMWSEEEFRIVEERAVEVLARFRNDALGSGRPLIAQWTQLDTPYKALPDTPSRLGYWVGWRAARAWRVAHPDAPLSDLFLVSPEELLTPILK